MKQVAFKWLQSTQQNCGNHSQLPDSFKDYDKTFLLYSKHLHTALNFLVEMNYTIQQILPMQSIGSNGMVTECTILAIKN